MEEPSINPPGADAIEVQKRPYRKRKQCDDEDPDDREGLDASVEQTKSRYMLGQRLVGIHWPSWLLKKEFPKLRPRKKSAMTYDGQAGFLLDLSHGEQLGTSRIYDCMKNGSILKDTLAHTDFVSRSTVNKIFGQVEKAVRVQVKPAGKIGKSENAPMAYALHAEIASSSDPNALLSSLWGCDFFATEERDVVNKDAMSSIGHGVAAICDGSSTDGTTSDAKDIKTIKCASATVIEVQEFLNTVSRYDTIEDLRNVSQAVVTGFLKKLESCLAGQAIKAYTKMQATDDDATPGATLMTNLHIVRQKVSKRI